MKRFAHFVVMGVLVVAPGCGGGGSSPTAAPTPAPPVEYSVETFSGTASCYGFHTFNMSAGGTVEAQFVSISRGGTMSLRLIQGVCPDSCNTVTEQIVGVGVTVSATLTAGTRSVSAGDLICDRTPILVTTPTTYTVQVRHPR